MKYKLEELFDLQMGKTPSRNNPKYWDTRENKWISIGDLSEAGKYISNTKEYLSDLAIIESGIKEIPANTVIMSFKLSIGKTAITSESMYSNEAIMAFYDKKTTELLPEYIYYLFQHKNWDEGTNTAVMGKTLNKATLSKIKVDIHSIDEQREIVNVLDKVSAIINEHRAILHESDSLVKSRFVQMFGNPETNPLRWREESLSCHLKVVGGFAFKSNRFSKAGIPVLRIGNINSGYFLPVNMVYWEEDSALSRYMVFPGDLVMSLTGTVGKDDYGNVCILGNDFPRYYLNQRNAKLELEATINKHFLSELLKFTQVKKRLTGISRGVRQANIANNDILNLCVPVPPIELQDQFAAFAQQVDKLKATVKKSIDQLQILFESLLQKYFGQGDEGDE